MTSYRRTVNDGRTLITSPNEWRWNSPPADAYSFMAMSSEQDRTIDFGRYGETGVWLRSPGTAKGSGN
jgi:hypothetical protein